MSQEIQQRELEKVKGLNRSRALRPNDLTIKAKRLAIFCLLVLCISSGLLYADSNSIDSPKFDDFPLKQPIENPDWFKLSFLELKIDLREAKSNKKSGLLLYFGQRRCPYCKKFLEDNFSKKDVLKYVKSKFDVIGINVRGDKEVIDFNGKSLPEKQFAAEIKANFTPSLIFYNLEGKMILKLIGYQSPYRFRAAMEYVYDDHYKKESFRDYLSRAKKDLTDKLAGLNQQPFFKKPPYQLDRRKDKQAKPLIVFFEQGKCHACDVLHTGPLMHSKTQNNLKAFDMVQLNMWADTKVVTPTGKEMTAKQWADQLDINYAPTLIVFDHEGKEIIRIGSVVHFFRLNNMLRYVTEGAYKKYGNYRRWRMSESIGK